MVITLKLNSWTPLHNRKTLQLKSQLSADGWTEKDFALLNKILNETKYKKKIVKEKCFKTQIEQKK